MRFLAGLVLIALAAASAEGQTTVFSEDMGTPAAPTSVTTYDGWQNNGILTFTGTGEVRSTEASSGYAGASGGGNVYLTASPGTNFEISGVNTSSRSSMQLTFGVFKSKIAATGSDLLLEVSADGTNYSPLSFNALPVGDGTAHWYQRNTVGSIPSTSNLRVRFAQTGSTTAYRIDDVVLLYDVPLPVTMKGISATIEAGQIHLTFSTASETEMAGFNIYRSLLKDGPFELISSYKSNVCLRCSSNSTTGASYSFVDSKVTRGSTYYYRVESVNTSGVAEEAHGIIEVLVPLLLPAEFAVSQNYPNPFNPVTLIKYQLPAVCHVSLRVFDVLGREVVTLVERQENAGHHGVEFDGSRYASGVYYYKLTAIDERGKMFARTQRMVLMK